MLLVFLRLGSVPVPVRSFGKLTLVSIHFFRTIVFRGFIRHGSETVLERVAVQKPLLSVHFFRAARLERFIKRCSVA